MRPYLNLLDVKTSSDGRVLAYFPDGSLAAISSSAILFYVDAKYYSEYETDSGSSAPDEMQSGTKCFYLLSGLQTKRNNIITIKVLSHMHTCGTAQEKAYLKVNTDVKKIQTVQDLIVPNLSK